MKWRRASLVLTTGFGFAALGLLAAAPISEVAFAPGELRTAERIASVRHAAGGDVVESFIEVDAFVRAGEPLLRLDDRALIGERERLRARIAHAGLRRDRLAALLDGDAFEPTAADGLDIADLENALRLFDAESSDLEAERASALARVAERRADLDAIVAASIGARAQIEALEEQVAIADSLIGRGLGRETERLDAVARLADVSSRFAESDGRRGAAAQALAQAEAEANRIEARRLAGWSAELVTVQAEIAELSAALSDVESQLRALRIVSPIDGRILEIGAATVGDALPPGGLVAIVAPVDVSTREALVAEVRLSPDDVGHVRVGEEAVVEVSTFESDLFGELIGTVSAVSPGALDDERGGRFFRVTLSLDRTSTQLGDAVLRLSPGMRVTARLTTAETTVLGRLIDPVTDALSVALAER